MRIELNFSINDLCREYSYSELMTTAFEIFDHISEYIESKNVNLSKSNDYNIYISYRQSENGETGSFVYIINDDQNSIFALEKLFAIGKVAKDINLVPKVLVKYNLQGLSNTINILQISGLDPRKVPLMAY